MNPVTVGSGLQVNASGNLGAGNHGGVTVTLTSSNAALLLAPNAGTPGTSSIQIAVPNGTQGFNYFVQGLEGATDTVTVAVTAVASGFTNGNGIADVVPPAFDIQGLGASYTSGGPDVAFYVRTGIANSTYAFLTQLQDVRAGAPGPLTVSFSTNAPGVATLVDSTGTGTTRTAAIAVGQSNSPTTVATGGVAFRPLTPGAVDITALIAGFIGAPGLRSVTVQ
jgi:hypothetical protein